MHRMHSHSPFLKLFLLVLKPLGEVSRHHRGVTLVGDIVSLIALRSRAGRLSMVRHGQTKMGQESETSFERERQGSEVEKKEQEARQFVEGSERIE